MHRIRLAGFIIDCQTNNLEAAADFWSNALGLPRQVLAAVVQIIGGPHDHFEFA